MSILPSKACCVVLTAVVACASVSNAYAGGRGGFGGAMWIPRGPMARPSGPLPSNPVPGMSGQFNVTVQWGKPGNGRPGDGHWGRPGNGGGHFPCGGWGRGGCWGNYAAVGGAMGLIYPPPAENNVPYYAPVYYDAVAYAPAPPPDPTTSCWVQKLSYGDDGSFLGSHRINACKVGPKVIDLSAVR